MFTVKSNLPINGRHWGLAFTDGIAHTANVALAAKLLLKGYVVTDDAVQSETDSQPKAVPSENTVAKQTPEAVRDPAITPTEITATEPAETPKPKTTKSRKRAVKADAADAG